VGSSPIGYPQKTPFQLIRSGVFHFAIVVSTLKEDKLFFVLAIHQKALLKAHKGKKNNVFALFLKYVQYT
jgi:hypothetical protein